MNNTLHSRLSALTETVHNIGSYFSKQNDVIPPTQQNRVNGNALGLSAQHAGWVEDTKFVNLKTMRIQVPEGFKSTFAAYLEDLESVWSMISKMDIDLLKPLSMHLANLANKPNRLAIPNTFRTTDIKSTLLEIDPADYVAKLARHFDGKPSTTAEFGKVYRNAADLDVIAIRVLALNEQIDTASRRQISRLISTISLSAGELSEVSDIASNNSEALNHVLFRTAKWVELMGMFMLQASSLHSSVVSTAEKIEALSSNENKK